MPWTDHGQHSQTDSLHHPFPVVLGLSLWTCHGRASSFSFSLPVASELSLTNQIRDLEARVEILSGDKEERVELMLLLVRNLLKENKDLRSMVKSMAVFIGEGEHR